MTQHEPVLDGICGRFDRLVGEELSVGLPVAHPLSTNPIQLNYQDPRSVLEDIVGQAIRAERVYVLFSGGRDSSAILALAVHAARAAGADDPVPVTVQHRGDRNSDESEWQDIVLDHLSVHDRIILEFEGDQTLLAPATQDSLRRHGLIWPEALQLHGAIYERLTPGTLLSGEGGDMVIAARRARPFVEAVRTGHPRRAMRLLGPTAFPGRRITGGSGLPWLTDRGRSLVFDAFRQWEREPLHAGRGIRQHMRLPTMYVGERNFVAVAGEFGLRSVNPFFHPKFIGALAREGGALGLGDRTAMMRRLFADILPDRVLARTTKASFNNTRWGVREDEFARTWDGQGVDHEYVRPDVLQASWLRGEWAGTAFQLHAAWLAHNRLPFVPDGT